MTVERGAAEGWWFVHTFMKIARCELPERGIPGFSPADDRSLIADEVGEEAIITGAGRGGGKSDRSNPRRGYS